MQTRAAQATRDIAESAAQRRRVPLQHAGTLFATESPATTTMLDLRLRLNPRQRRLLGDKILDAANLSLGGLAFARRWPVGGRRWFPLAWASG